MDITQLLAFSVKNKASDLHLSAGLPPMLRVHGDVRRLNLPDLSHKEVLDMIYDIMSDSQRQRFEDIQHNFSSFAKNLLPWADQPEPVLASLRQVQAEMTRATLASCVRQNLMTPAQAAAMQRELGLGDPPGAETLPQPSGSGVPIRP
jgi:hypothetical protein